MLYNDNAEKRTCSCSDSMQLQVENDLICTYIKQPYILSLLTADLKQKPYATHRTHQSQCNAPHTASAARRRAPQMSIPRRLLSFRRALTQSITGLPPLKKKKTRSGSNKVVKSHGDVDTQFVIAALSFSYVYQLEQRTPPPH